jgi:hypothetical protein
MRRFPVLPGIEALQVFADHDTSEAGEAGQRAAEEVIARWRDAGREATGRMPIDCGDFNDIVVRSANARRS